MSFAIMVRERGADQMTELARVNSNPEAIAQGAREKTLKILTNGSAVRRKTVPKYELVKVVEL